MPNDDANIDILASGKFMQMVRDGRWEYVRRHTAEGAVAIIATTDEDELILVEQLRVPFGRRCIELPAGLAGDTEADKGEALLQAARRELLEETGYAAAHFQHLYPVATSPGLTSETIDLFRATGLTQQHAGGGVAGEDITTHRIKLDQLDAWLAEQQATGSIVDVKVYLAAAYVR